MSCCRLGAEKVGDRMKIGLNGWRIFLSFAIPTSRYILLGQIQLCFIIISLTANDCYQRNKDCYSKCSFSSVWQICFRIVAKRFHINENVTSSNIETINIQRAERLVLELDLELENCAKTKKCVNSGFMLCNTMTRLTATAIFAL